MKISNNGWQVKSLGEALESLESGGRPKGGGLSAGDIPSLGAEHLNDQGRFNLDSTKYIPKDYFNSMQRGIININDILVVKDGATTGKVSFVKNDFPFKQAAINEHLFLIRTNKEILNPLFAFYFLYSSVGNSQIMTDFRGSAQGGISREFVNKVSIPLPPLPIQKQIAEILEKADETKQKRKEANKLTDEFLQSVFIEMFGDPVKNPKGWYTVTLDTLGEWQSGGTPSRLNKEYFLGEIPWFTSGELNTMYLTESIESITEKAIVDSNAKLIEPNTILVGMYDTAAFKLGITKNNCSCNQAIAYSKLESNKVDKLFLYYLMKIGREFFISGQRGVRQKNLNLTMIRETKITLPPIKLQQQFAEIVNKTEALKEKQKQSEQELENLFQSLMQRAFKGELVS